MHYDAVIVGGGVAGLACARVLQQNNLSYMILESTDQLGGRIQTDLVDGFQLDHGFQVIQTGYPDIAQNLDLKALQLHNFPAGVAVHYNGKFHIIADPRHHPRHLLSTLSSPLGNFNDRLCMLKLAYQVIRQPLAKIFDEPEEKTIDFLQRSGFSNQFIRSFFVPFFAGACLDRNINASSRVLKYIFRIFATGDAALPARGMAQIPQQIARSLAPNAIHFNSKVTHIDEGTVTLDNGKTITGRHIVVATPEPVLPDLLPVEQIRKSVSESCLYYASDWTPPLKEPFLILNGDDRGPVNNIAFPSLVAPEYAPAGKTLIAVVVVDETFVSRDDLESLVRNQCHEWFGAAVNGWEHLRTYRIEHALPDQSPPTHNPYDLAPSFNKNITICGEYQSLPGLQWAIMSGDMAGNNLVKTLQP